MVKLDKLIAKHQRLKDRLNEARDKRDKAGQLYYKLDTDLDILEDEIRYKAYEGVDTDWLVQHVNVCCGDNIPHVPTLCPAQYNALEIYVVHSFGGDHAVALLLSVEDGMWHLMPGKVDSGWYIEWNTYDPDIHHGLSFKRALDLAEKILLDLGAITDAQHRTLTMLLDQHFDTEGGE